MHTAIKNSVITGTLENEFSLVTRFLDEYKGTFSNNYIRKYEPLDLPQFTNIRWYEKNDTVFKIFIMITRKIIISILNLILFHLFVI